MKKDRKQRFAKEAYQQMAFICPIISNTHTSSKCCLKLIDHLANDHLFYTLRYTMRLSTAATTTITIIIEEKSSHFSCICQSMRKMRKMILNNLNGNSFLTFLLRFFFMSFALFCYDSKQMSLWLLLLLFCLMILWSSSWSYSISMDLFPQRLNKNLRKRERNFVFLCVYDRGREQGGGKVR